MPSALNQLGLSTRQLHHHTAFDIGAAGVARELAAMLQAPLLLQNYSRLVIDCNRPLDAPDSIPAMSHGVSVPGNARLDAHAQTRRINELFTPYDDALRAMLDKPGKTHAFAIHSFTATLGEHKRPWDIGFLYRKDTNTSKAMAKFVQRDFPRLCVGLNQPYQIDDESDWFVPQHAERLGLQHSLIEIRNDLINTTESQQQYATVLAAAIMHVCPEAIAP